MKYLYLISQEVNNGYDTYDSAVVCATSEDEAKLIHPFEGKLEADDSTWNDYHYSAWCQPKDVKVELIGVAQEGVDDVICASFNAG